MTKQAFLEMITRNAKEYRLKCKDSLKRNSHIHALSDFEKATIQQPMVDAVLADFVNFVAMRQGVDWGLYTKDLCDSTDKTVNPPVVNEDVGDDRDILP